MRRFLPKSLIGQIALVMAAALLVAQAINFGLVFNERQRATHSQIEGPPIARFVQLVQRLAPMDSAARADLIAERGRRGRFAIAGESSVPAEASEARIVARLRDQAEQNGLALRDARAAVRDEVELPRRLRDRLSPEELDRARARLRRMQTLHLSAQLADGSWVNARLVTPRPNPWLAARLAGSTLLIYLLILAAVTLIAMRLGRPLRALTAAAQSFEGRGEAPQVDPGAHRVEGEDRAAHVGGPLRLDLGRLAAAFEALRGGGQRAQGAREARGDPHQSGEDQDVDQQGRAGEARGEPGIGPRRQHPGVEPASVIELR